jgi:type II secretory pathway component PulF
MPTYRFKARDKEGVLHQGTMSAGRRESVADHISGQGFIPVLIEEERESALQADLLAGLTRVKPQDLIVFSRQLATLLSAGVPFIQSLTTLEKQTENPRLRRTVAVVRQDIENGSAFSDALSRHPKVFNRLYVSMVHAGEAAGMLDDILERLALLAEHDAETRARVKAAVRYPLIVVISLSLAFAFLTSFVIPRFSAIFGQFKTELPFPTRVLVDLSRLIRHDWIGLILGTVLLAWGVSRYIGSTQGRRQWDRLKLGLPVFGVLFQKVALSRFARVFSAMQKSGLSMMLTLEIAAEVAGNVVIARVVEEMRESLREGKRLLGPMEASGLFPPLVMQMMAVGEETGKVDMMLKKVSDYYDMDVEYTLRTLSTMIEPILLLLVGGMVLFLALGIFLPMWDMMSLFKK